MLSPPRTACFISELTVEPLQAVCVCVLVLRMQMHFKANRVTEKRGEAAEGGKRRLSLTKRDEDADLV